jgi:hypothetical protein
MPRNLLSVADNKTADSVRHKLTGFHKAGVFVLLAFIISQSLIIFNVADAGDITAKSLLACTNSIRLKYRPNELVINEKLNAAAQKKLEDMIKDSYWAHENPNTHQKPWDFVDAAGYYYETTGENLALGFESAQGACDAWEKSKTHLSNIADSTYGEIGFAIDKANLHKNGKGILIVQMFGSRKDFGASAGGANSGTVLGTATGTTQTSGTSSASNTSETSAPAGIAPGLSEQSGFIDLHPSAEESTIFDWLKIIMPYITGLFYVTIVVVVIINGINKRKNRKGFSDGLTLFLAISSILATLVYLILT